MIDPPNPGMPALLLAAAAKLGWRISTRDPSGAELGTFTDGASDRHLLLVGDAAPGSVQWMITGTMPAGFGAFVLDRPTYDVLHGGTPNGDGSIAFGGRSYHVQSWFTGAQWTARAVSATLPAA